MTERPDHREVLERMLTEQPDRLPRKMRSAGYRSAEAEDLAQEALMRAVQSVAGLRGEADEALVCGWVDTIAQNLIRNQRRDAARRPPTDALQDHPEVEPAGGDDPVDAVIDASCEAALNELILALPQDKRAVFVGRVIEQRSTAEVAAQLGITENLVRWRLHKAREQLRARIDELS